MIKVAMESPYAGDRENNVKYARRLMKDCLIKNEAPVASHLLYTQVLDDDVPEERSLGIMAGMKWSIEAEKAVFGIDYGISKGMAQAIPLYEEKGIVIEMRKIGKNP